MDIRIITSWDDCCEENYRLAELLKKHRLPGIFFIPTTERPLCAKQIRDLADQGFEIGCHTKTHPSDLKILSDDLLMSEIKDCRRELQKLANQEIEWFCYPRGRYDLRVKSIVRNAEFKYARTTKILNIEPPEDNFEIKTAVHVGYPRREYKGKDWLDIAIGLLDKARKKENSVFHLWGHGWEITILNQWEKLEGFLKTLSECYNKTS